MLAICLIISKLRGEILKGLKSAFARSSRHEQGEEVNLQGLLLYDLIRSIIAPGKDQSSPDVSVIVVVQSTKLQARTEFGVHRLIFRSRQVR